MTTMLPQYESMLEAVYRAALQPGDVAVDIGAHVGRHTFPIARAVGPAGKVFAFEPLPAAYAELRRKVEYAQASGGDLAAIITHNVALGEEEGEAKFVFVPDFPEYSGFRERTYHDDSLRRERIGVRVLRLDSYGADFGRVRFIKIDAEGGELMILRGGGDAHQPVGAHRFIRTGERLPDELSVYSGGLLRFLCQPWLHSVLHFRYSAIAGAFHFRGGGAVLLGLCCSPRADPLATWS